MNKPKIEDIKLKEMAESIRKIADEIEKGEFVAFAMVGCDDEGGSLQACMVNPEMATHELIDEMVYETKRMLFASYEA